MLFMCYYFIFSKIYNFFPVKATTRRCICGFINDTSFYIAIELSFIQISTFLLNGASCTHFEKAF